METRYCIQCEKEVPVTETQDGYIHTHTITHTMVCGCPEYDVIVCDGAFTTSPPPDVPELEIVEIPDREYELYNVMGLMMMEML